MQNINTKEYWETRFKTGNWNKNGQRQTREYALANVKNMDLSDEFAGSILDFGCAQGDAIPIYKNAFPNASIFGIDLSETAIETCKIRFGEIAQFESGDFNKIKPKDLIIASHIMEHLTGDREIIKDLLPKCKELYVFVPYKENPLYHEHVNYYDEDYYYDFDLKTKKVFTVNYKYRYSLRQLLSNLIYGKISLFHNFSKEIIMFQIKGQIL